MKKVSIALGLIIVCTGCTGLKKLPPSFYALGTSIAVQHAVEGASPSTMEELHLVQQTFCNVAMGGSLAPVNFQNSTSGLNLSKTTETIANIALFAYIPIYNSLSKTNQDTLAPYVQAIMCDGFANGLGGSSTATRLRAIAAKPSKLSDPIWTFLNSN